MVSGGNTAAFAKTICSICYEDLKPIVEDLQSIFICGHVFHELCLQQWFEYCTNGKKKNCPVCKQSCSNANVGRLYFQSIGDPNDQSATQKPSDCDENPEELRNEVQRLEGKVSGLSSALERQNKSFEGVNAELSVLKEQLKVQVALKIEALNQNATIQQLIHLKSEELDRSTLECMRLQDRNMALAKELAALKLVSDLNLEEGEVLKLACLGNEVNSKETVDVLKKSLVIRNKSYKELMTKCNLLGRGEARSLIKLEKAQEKIKKLKERVQELESVIELKDNEALRTLKASGAATCVTNKLNKGFDRGTKTGVCSYGDQNKAFYLPETYMAVEGEMDDYSSCLRKKRKLESSGFTSHGGTTDNMVPRKLTPDNQERGPFLINEDENVSEASAPSFSCRLFKSSDENGASKAGDKESNTHVQGQGNKDGVSGILGVIQSGSKKKIATKADDVTVIDVDIALSQPLANVNKETPSPFVVSNPVTGDRCFTGGLLGPDGTKWHLGKWCKRTHNKGQASLTTGLQGSNAFSGDLIAVGADGRGGKIKVLRSLNQPSLDNKETLISTKKGQNGAKPSTLQPRGCLQIEHFFGRASQ